jgi:hypothetical protein
MTLFKISSAFFIIFLIFPCLLEAQAFVHPGILHGKEDLERMKKAVLNKEEPVFSDYQLFIQNPVSQNIYQMQGPLIMVGRNPTIGQGTYDTDANAAHQNAIMWCITGDKAYADKAIEIINAWSSTLKSITGRDAVLMAGLGPFKMINAAEILRYTNAGWAEKDILVAEKHFKEVIYPVIKDFAPFANGNWDAAAIKTMMAIGVFCNDREIFERALHYYIVGHGNGSLSHYIINDDGQIQESGRDQGHTQLGIAMLAECSEIAWHQGLNLYGYENNRLLKGFEYVAKFNLGNEVPFVPWLDRTGKYAHKQISQLDRGSLRAVYEQVFNHYVHRMGLEAPFTKQAAEKIRPEGPGRPGADHPGYGTLYFTIPAQKDPMAQLTAPIQPGALIAHGATGGISLRWIESVGAKGYDVKRAIHKEGPYKMIATNISNASYIDQKVTAGTIFYYTVAATNAKGTSGYSLPVSVAAGLPNPWVEKTIGNTSLPGEAAFDGKEFRIEGSGMGLDSLVDAFHYVYYPLKGDGEICVRFVPQPSSQFSQIGLMIRENLEDNAAYSALMIYPGKTNSAEAPCWQVRWNSRQAKGELAKTETAIPALEAPVVTFGRLTGEYWLRLQRKGNMISGFTSYDGKTWISAGTASFKEKKAWIGFAVASGIASRTTTVMFDRIECNK